MVRVWTKPQTQEFIKRLRAAGYTVERGNGKYEVNIDGVNIFRALIGRRGYLIRMDNRLVTENENG